ncbi:MAG: NAD(P)-dependent alcohol dehydrogenase [Prolixibacteraceae bacterium]
MKAIICTQYGPPEVLQLAEVEKPEPKKNEVLIKIHDTAVTASDCIVRGFNLPRWKPMGFMMGLVLGFKKPRQPILGMVLSGVVESSGKSVSKFNRGDQIYGWTISAASRLKFSTYAEYICLNENATIAKKPEKLSFEEAAAIPYGGLMALSYLKKLGVKNDAKILIYGASGAIGTAAVQLAKYLGAEVTAVCSTANLELVKSLGADSTIDYTKEKLTATGELFDCILDAVGKKKSNELASRRLCNNLLAPNGKYISVDDGSPKIRIEDLTFLNQASEAGKLKGVIDRTFPLKQMAEAHRYVEKGHKKGNVIIKVEEN